jgi:hypothetical protein
MYQFFYEMLAMLRYQALFRVEGDKISRHKKDNKIYG